MEMRMTNTWSEDASKILSDVMADFAKSERLAEHKLAKSNPEKYRLCPIFPNGYNYYPFYVLDKKDTKGNIIESHSWCRSTRKNSAGYFIIWYQIQDYKKKTTKRTNFKAEKLRVDADEFCQRMKDQKRFLKKSEIVENFKQTF
tara:strand:+ start:107 stop:538 length:432 start_codon:yes stop_codon:yes gene_type:complete